MKKKITSILKKAKNPFYRIPKYFYYLLFISFFLMLPIIQSKIAWGHDYPFHISNLVSVSEYLSITNLNLIYTKVFGGALVNGLGYGVGIFYPPMAYVVSGYAGYFLHKIGIAYPYVITIIEFLVMFLSSISMFGLAKKIFKNDGIAFLSSISYISAPYFLSDIYVRCALNELFVFALLPIVFTGLYYLFCHDYHRFLLYFVIGYSGMIFTHIPISIFLTVFVIILLIVNYKKTFYKSAIKYLFLSAIIILAITSSFWLLLLQHKLLGNYQVFQNGIMASLESINSEILSIKDLFLIQELDYCAKVHLYVNLVVFFIFLLVVVNYKKILKEKEKVFFISSLIIFGITLILLCSHTIWKFLPETLYMIQFSWRLEIFLTFSMSLLAGLILRLFKEQVRSFVLYVCVFGTVLMAFTTITLERITFPNIPSDMAFDAVIGAQHEYLPVKAAKNMDYLKKRKNSIYILNGEANIIEKINKTPYLLAEIKLKTNEVTLELPRLYYYGYKITLTSNGKTRNIEYTEDSNGLIRIKLKESGTLCIKYTGGVLNIAGQIISVTTILLFIVFYRVNRKKK